MNKKLFVFVFAALAGVAAEAQLQSTGWKRPLATHFPNDWTYPQEAFESDDQYAQVLHQSGCRCPFMDLSGDRGATWSGSNIFGPYGTSDSWRTQGDSTDSWGYAWTDTSFTDSNFVLRIWNSSTLLRQGYANFGFGIPSGSTITGIEVRVEARGDSSYTMDYVDVIELNVYFLPPATTIAVQPDENIPTVYPNPARHFVRIHFTQDVLVQKVRILDLQGNILRENVFPSLVAGNEYSVDVRDFLPGIYFLNFLTANGSANTKLVIR